MASQHIFGVECPGCGCTVYYDKRIVCVDDGTVLRRVRFRDVGGKELDRLFLRCTCGDCESEVTVEVDCEAYK